MPELPEVETIVRQLRERGVEGRTIEQVRITWAPMVAPYSKRAFTQRLQNRQILSVERRGKWIEMALSDGHFLFIHLRMAGSFSDQPSPHDRAVMKLSGDLHLYYRDTRKFGRWLWVEDPKTITDRLGPDALSRRFSCSYFAKLLATRSRQLKPLLLDQACVAGLGNIYADEALWLSQLHPQRRADTLTQKEVQALYTAIRKVLRIGVANRGTSLGEGKSNYRDMEGSSGENRAQVQAYGRGGKPCPRCGTPLIKIVVAQRGTTLCPRCQMQ